MFAALMELVRQHLYLPDGRLPQMMVKGRPWTSAREGSVLKQLLKRYSPRDVAIAIEGLALVRDFPGLYADPVAWLVPGHKVTLLALYWTRSGSLSTFTIATQAYWKWHNSRRAASAPAGFQTVGDLLRHAGLSVP